MEESVEVAGGDVVLGMHDTFSAVGGGGSSVLTPGYVAIVSAPSGTFEKRL